MKMNDIKSYTELQKFQTFKDRFNYLKLNGKIGEDTFGFDRWINQVFYNSSEWRKIRDLVIVRDNGNDLGVDGFQIYGKILIHHMNPINLQNIIHRDSDILNPEYLICVSHKTHNAIHYGSENLLPIGPIERTQNDTCPWKGGTNENISKWN